MYENQYNTAHNSRSPVQTTTSQFYAYTALYTFYSTRSGCGMLIPTFQV